MGNDDFMGMVFDGGGEYFAGVGQGAVDCSDRD